MGKLNARGMHSSQSVVIDADNAHDDSLPIASNSCWSIRSVDCRKRPAHWCGQSSQSDPGACVRTQHDVQSDRAIRLEFLARLSKQSWTGSRGRRRQWGCASLGSGRFTGRAQGAHRTSRIGSQCAKRLRRIDPVLLKSATTFRGLRAASEGEPELRLWLAVAGRGHDTQTGRPEDGSRSRRRIVSVTSAHPCPPACVPYIRLTSERLVSVCCRFSVSA